MKALAELTLGDYTKQTTQEEVVSYVVENFLKKNKVLRMNEKNILPSHSDIWSYKWKDIISMRQSVKEYDIVEALAIFYNIEKKQIANANFINALACYNYLVDQLIIISKAEEAKLSQEPSTKEKKAGIEEFQIYEEYNSIRLMTGGDLTKEEFYLNLPYQKIFLEMSYKILLGKYNREIYKSNGGN